jgi:hypothetical protein
LSDVRIFDTGFRYVLQRRHKMLDPGAQTPNAGTARALARFLLPRACAPAAYVGLGFENLLPPGQSFSFLKDTGLERLAVVKPLSFCGHG